MKIFRQLILGERKSCLLVLAGKCANLQFKLIRKDLENQLGWKLTGIDRVLVMPDIWHCESVCLDRVCCSEEQEGLERPERSFN